MSDLDGNWPKWATKVLVGAAVIAAAAIVTVATGGAISIGLTSNVCFVADTAVLTAVGYVAIEDISSGDKVWSENSETGEKALKEVV